MYTAHVLCVRTGNRKFMPGSQEQLELRGIRERTLLSDEEREDAIASTLPTGGSDPAVRARNLAPKLRDNAEQAHARLVSQQEAAGKVYSLARHSSIGCQTVRRIC